MRCNIPSVNSTLRSVSPLNDPYGSNELNKPLTDRYNAGVLDNPQHVPRKVPGGQKETVPFNARPYDAYVERKELNNVIILNAARKLHTLMNESYDGYTYICRNNTKCLFFGITAPLGFTAEDRYTWISFIRRDFTDSYFYPIVLQILIDHGGAVASKWKILKVLYNNQTFNSVEDLVAK